MIFRFVEVRLTTRLVDYQLERIYSNVTIDAAFTSIVCAWEGGEGREGGRLVSTTITLVFTISTAFSSLCFHLVFFIIIVLKK